MQFLLALALTLLCAGFAQAQEKFPNRPITIVVAHPAGGSVDMTGRAIAGALERVLGQPVVVQNRPGAAGAIGTQAVANGAHDGYTLLVATADVAVLPAVDTLYDRKTTFTRAQFQPIARLTADPIFLVVNGGQPWKTFKDLIDDAKKRPSTIVYSSGGLYGATHLPVELLLRSAGVTMRHLPSSGGGPAMVSVLGNHAQVVASHPGVARPQVEAGKVRLLATWGGERSKVFPDVPTLKELGHDIEYYLWMGIFAPTNVPEPAMKIIRAAVAKAVQDPEYVAQLEKRGSTPAYLDTQAFAKFWEEDSKTLETAVRTIGRSQ